MKRHGMEHVSAPLQRVLIMILRNATPEQISRILRKTESIQQKDKSND